MSTTRQPSPQGSPGERSAKAAARRVAVNAATWAWLQLGGSAVLAGGIACAASGGWAQADWLDLAMLLIAALSLGCLTCWHWRDLQQEVPRTLAGLTDPPDAGAVWREVRGVWLWSHLMAVTLGVAAGLLAGNPHLRTSAAAWWHWLLTRLGGRS